ncbi:uncharacterized protein MELLADRAFT_106718 [Melampsora larici-populina 98AG31]|uniref:Uncharacterized protein n=1 Tax=Melampsora larici-populina (strain 98AG31 / pathotype 3-4-7) TaxID=747676 RepID=F4RMF0_MELLP|nr:uncharacterized protein MELLADRAFT_106718 [Melampsora larici-populina 98AG31]EGG06415.1 hypothetical protein MELLADRAFT_106718 [Melampsora larici-populina 98AG31]
MDLLNKKSYQTIALILNWPILLTAMGVWDFSKTIGHPISTTESYASYLAKTFDPALHEQGVSELDNEHASGILFDAPGTWTANIPATSIGHIPPIDEFYNDIYGKSYLQSLQSLGQMNTGVFKTRDGAVIDHSSGAGIEIREQRPILQGTGQETQSDVFPPGPQIEPPWRDSHILTSPSSEALMDNLRGGPWDHLEVEPESNWYHRESNHEISQPPELKPDSPSWFEVLDRLPPASTEVTGAKPHYEWRPVNAQISPSSSEEPSWRDSHILHPTSGALMDSLGQGSWENFEDQLENKMYHHESTHTISQLPDLELDSSWLEVLSGLHPASPEVSGPKPSYEWRSDNVQRTQSIHDHPLRTPKIFGTSSPEYEQPHHREVSQDELFDKLPSPDLTAPLARHDHYTLSNDHISPSTTDPYDEITTTVYPAEHTTMHDETHPMPYLQYSFPSSSPEYQFNGVLRNDRFHSNNPSETFNKKHNQIVDDASSRPPVSPVISSLSNGRRPLGTLEDMTNFLTHDTAHSTQPMIPVLESQQGSERSSNFGFRDFPPTSHPLFQYPSPASHAHKDFLNQAEVPSLGSSRSKKGEEPENQADIFEFEHPEDLLRSGGLSMHPHSYSSTQSVPLSEQRLLSKEPSKIFVDNDAWTDFEATNEAVRSEGYASSRFLEKNNQWNPSQNNPDDRNLDQKKDSSTSQGKRLFSQESASLSRTTHLERPSQTHQGNSQSTKRKAADDSSSFANDYGFISQVERLPSFLDDERFTSDPSNLPNRLSSELVSKPRKTLRGLSRSTFVSKSKEQHQEAISSNTDDLQKHDSKLRAIEIYYGENWPHERLKKAQLAYLSETSHTAADTISPLSSTSPQQESGLDYDKNHGHGLELISNLNHTPLPPRALIDTYQDKVLEFLKPMGAHQISERHMTYLVENMKKTWDNYLEMLSVCSEVVLSNGLHTDMLKDLQDGHNWLKEKLAKITSTRFEWLPLQGLRRPPEKADKSNVFRAQFDKLSLYDGTIFWLTHRMFDRRRERVGAMYALEFIKDQRKDWIAHLTPSSADELVVRTLMIFTKRVRPLKYPNRVQTSTTTFRKGMPRLSGTANSRIGMWAVGTEYPPVGQGCTARPIPYLCDLGCKDQVSYVHVHWSEIMKGKAPSSANTLGTKLSVKLCTNCISSSEELERLLTAMNSQGIRDQSYQNKDLIVYNNSDRVNVLALPFAWVMRDGSLHL